MSVRASVGGSPLTGAVKLRLEAYYVEEARAGRLLGAYPNLGERILFVARGVFEQNPNLFPTDEAQARFMESFRHRVGQTLLGRLSEFIGRDPLPRNVLRLIGKTQGEDFLRPGNLKNAFNAALDPFILNALLQEQGDLVSEAEVATDARVLLQEMEEARSCCSCGVQ